jgi:Fe-S-cluster containining protein
MEQEKKELCLDCGLCCRGNLFNAVPLYGDETKLFDKNRIQTEWGLIHSITIQTKHITSYKTVYPCEHIKEDNKCSIYHKRPKTCRDFKCQVLRDYEAGKIDYSSAINKIEEVKKIPHSQQNRITAKNLLVNPQA